MASLEQLCRDYLDDRLPPEERKWMEERISNGDEVIIATLRRFQSFGSGFSASGTEPGRPQEENDRKLADFLNQEESDSEPDEPAGPPSRDIADNALDQSGVRHRFIRMMTLVGIGVLFLVVFQQWRYYQLDRENEMLSRQVEQNNRQLLEIDERASHLAQQNSHLQHLLFQPQTYIQRIEMAERSGRMMFLWETDGWSHALLTDQIRLGGEEHFRIWHNTTDDQQEWATLTTVQEVSDDSLISGWDTGVMQESQNLEFRLHSQAGSQQREEGQLLGEIALH